MARIITNFIGTSVDSCELVNGTEGISDIEGKAAAGSGERAGMRASFKFLSRWCDLCLSCFTKKVSRSAWLAMRLAQKLPLNSHQASRFFQRRSTQRSWILG